MSLLSYPTDDTLFLLDAAISINLLENLRLTVFIERVSAIFPLARKLWGPRPEESVIRLNKLSENMRTYIICALLVMQRLQKQSVSCQNPKRESAFREMQLAESKAAFYVLIRIYIKIYEQRDLRASTFATFCDTSPRDLNFLELEILERKFLMRCDWEVVKKCFEEQPNYIDYIPTPENGLFPVDQDKVFRALNLVGSSQNVRIIIIGQDPYPRAASAVGISFLDGAIEDFQSPQLAPSIRHILQAILVSLKLMGPSDNVDKMRSVLKEHMEETQTEWFTSLATQCGVLWLNRSLTFGGKDPKTLQTHLNFWKPVIHVILEEVVKSRADKGLIVLLWGSKAADLRPVLVQLAGKYKSSSIKVLLNIHPLNHAFPGARVFETVRKIEEELHMGVTDFLKAQVSNV